MKELTGLRYLTIERQEFSDGSSNFAIHATRCIYGTPRRFQDSYDTPYLADALEEIQDYLGVPIPDEEKPFDAILERNK